MMKIRIPFTADQIMLSQANFYGSKIFINCKKANINGSKHQGFYRKCAQIPGFFLCCNFSYCQCGTNTGLKTY